MCRYYMFAMQLFIAQGPKTLDTFASRWSCVALERPLFALPLSSLCREDDGSTRLHAGTLRATGEGVMSPYGMSSDAWRKITRN